MKEKINAVAHVPRVRCLRCHPNKHSGMRGTKPRLTEMNEIKKQQSRELGLHLVNYKPVPGKVSDRAVSPNRKPSFSFSKQTVSFIWTCNLMIYCLVIRNFIDHVALTNF